MQSITTAYNPHPFSSTDIQVVENNEIHKFKADDWNNDKHKLLVFIPEAFTPVCETEIGAINYWYDEFEKLGCEIIVAGTDPAGRFADWYKDEPKLSDLRSKTFSSYLLPTRLGLVQNGRVKRASVFVMNDGTVVKQEHFDKVGRSFAELHRMLYGFTTDSYCAEGWKSPEDGFLVKDEPNG